MKFRAHVQWPFLEKTSANSGSFFNQMQQRFNCLTRNMNMIVSMGYSLILPIRELKPIGLYADISSCAYLSSGLKIGSLDFFSKVKNGDFWNNKPMGANAGFYVKDCLYLGKCSLSYEFFDLAIEWYDLALSMSKEEANSAVESEKILHDIDEAIKEHDLTLGNQEYFKHTFHRPIGGLLLEEIKNLQIPTLSIYKLGLKLSFDEEMKNYNALCRGEHLRSRTRYRKLSNTNENNNNLCTKLPLYNSKKFTFLFRARINELEEANLNCYLSDREDASFYMNPIKVEVYSHDPPIYTFHDVIYESEINFIKEFSKPYLARSQVYNKNASEETSDIRTSQNTWMYDDEEDEKTREKLKIIMDRVSRITGLNVYGENNSEAMQVANYGIGGHYEPHIDYLFDDPSPKKVWKILSCIIPQALLCETNL
uniref:Prolyl 4-hydroxylase alpha subunit domain-containing protein n=1 Tax=Strigamia maritima TaxID=126957 RepID=T1JFP3_STRMM